MTTERVLDETLRILIGCLEDGSAVTPLRREMTLKALIELQERRAVEPRADAVANQCAHFCIGRKVAEDGRVYWACEACPQQFHESGAPIGGEAGDRAGPRVSPHEHRWLPPHDCGDPKCNGTGRVICATCPAEKSSAEPDKWEALRGDQWTPAEMERLTVPPQFTVCGTCQRKAAVTSQAEVKLLGIICERADCPGRPAQRTTPNP